MLSAVGIDGGHRDFVASIGSGLADAILQHDAEVGAVAEWLAANGVPAQTTDRAADEDEQRPADEWLWVLEACMLVAAGSPGDLSDEQWKRLADMEKSSSIQLRRRRRLRDVLRRFGAAALRCSMPELRNSRGARDGASGCWVLFRGAGCVHLRH